jgi:hypothetical protein
VGERQGRHGDEVCASRNWRRSNTSSGNLDR